MEKGYRLRKALSPYLRDHASQPVEWYPWGQEAFLRAQKEGKPLFISIGYATCHWCHEMSRENFVSEEVGEALNRYFVPVKVDRELDPAVDEVYLTACTLVHGSGGWPLNLFATPEGLPFYFLTYAPRPIFLDLVEKIARLWRECPQRLEEAAREVAALTRRALRNLPGEVEPEGLTARALHELKESFDPQYGGFGKGAKFPSAPVLYFLLDLARESSPEARAMLTKTLEAMSLYGLYDHVGGGFFRYTTDRAWQNPHYEKMLYDQVQLAEIYAEASRLFENPFFETVARETLDYLFGELSSPEGLFYTAQDAESPEGEGAYYLFRAPEILSALPEKGPLLVETFGLRSEPSLPQLREFPQKDLEPIKKALREYRQRRPRPRVDTKILCGENALAVAALARIGQELEAPEILSRARDLYRRLREVFWGPESLSRVLFEGRRGHPGHLEDYVRLARAALVLYEITREDSYLGEARALMELSHRRFWDPESGGFFSCEETDLLFVRPKESLDRAWPSANSLALEVLGGLGPDFRDLFESQAWAFGGALSQAPSAHPYFLRPLKK
ncbi:thioredoxin domain-containing protein [Thermosulfurimonas marina]|uniref:Thioredoxin domain-containing protein n=1 Tax=Thermosulfurimonas marina TaxID=2047767 RepID=A0A6H1WQD6_9BACT|nr:thioredoxin domain-containing protein [Thermosulfurimonas marina]QJA05370.1 thioredoxin domain-containing protein [Thermosulfurimonas marina]